MMLEAAGPVEATRRPSAGTASSRASRRLSVLLLCDDSRAHANTVRDHIAMFQAHSRHDVRLFNPIGLPRSRMLNLDEFDAVIVHYSLVVIFDHFLSPAFREQLRRYRGLKVQFIQDEYRWVNAVTAMMRTLGIHVLFTLLPEREIGKVYNERTLPGVTIHRTVAGYMPENLTGLETPPFESRPIDIGYRGRTLPFWLGELAQEKVWIGQGVLARAARYGLRCDIKWAEEDRLYGRRWIRFLSSCKATLATESGASITDFDGSVERLTKQYLAAHPGADFREVQKAVLEPFEGNVRMNQVSPRVFEAAALRTGLIMFPGEYSGVVQPWVHYLPLQKDFSNLAEVVEKLRDERFMRAMIETTYRDVVASGRYAPQTFVEEFDEILARHECERGTGPTIRYRAACLERQGHFAVRAVLRAVHPVASVLAAWLKGLVSLVLLLRTSGGFALLRCALALADGRWRLASSLLREVFLLGVVGQRRAGHRGNRGCWSVSVRYDPCDARCLLTSRASENQCESNGTDERAQWRALEEAAASGRLAHLAWDHSAVGGEARYALTSRRGLAVGMGEYDLHRFVAFEELFKRQPALSWGVFAGLVGGPK